jgi:hypothetical protein
MNQNQNQNQSPYWNAVNQMLASLPQELSQQSLQPADGGVYTTSVAKPLSPAHKAGRVACCPRKLACQNIIDGTHRLSTDEEIAAHLQEMAQRKRDITAFEQSRKGDVQRLTFSTPPVNTQGGM